MLLLSLLFVANTALAAGPTSDSVKLADNGKVLEGRVVFEGADDVVIRVDGKDQRMPRTKIAEIRSLERSLAPILDRDLRTADAPALRSLATDCQKAGIAAEAKNFWTWSLLSDATNDDAVQGAGARRAGKEIKLALGKDQRNLSDLTKRQDSWKSAYAIESSHFKLQSDLDLASLLDLSVALERFHKRFYDTLGAPLELYVLDEAPEVFVYGRAADFPVPPMKGDRVWFAPAANRLSVLADAETNIGAVVTELSKLMLFNALRRSAGPTTQVPAWTMNGIAVVFAVAAPSERFGPWRALDTVDPTSFALAASANLALDRVFNAAANDFNADPKRREMQASAYSLVHYLVFGEAGALRNGYGTFLREGAKGKISLGALSDALGKSQKDIASGWRTYVQANAK